MVSSRPRWVRVLTACGLLATAASVLLPLAHYALRPWRNASDADHQAAAAAINAAFAPGDVVLIHPWYLQRPWTYLGGRPHLILRELDDDDLIPYRRVHLLELRGAPGDGPAPGCLQRLRRVHAQSFGPLTYTLYEVPGARTLLYDFMQELRHAAVQVTYADAAAPVPCGTWEFNRWLCPRDPDWNYVGREILDFDDVPRQLIWAHPVDKGGMLRITFPQAVLGDTLAVAEAFTRWAATRGAAPVTVEVLINGTSMHRAQLPVGKGIMRYHLDTAALRGPATVEFLVSTPSNGSDHFGFLAYSYAVNAVGGAAP